jgi:hypothetical protein
MRYAETINSGYIVALAIRETPNKCHPRESGEPFFLAKHGFPLSRE